MGRLGNDRSSSERGRGAVLAVVPLLVVVLSGCWLAGRGNSQNTGWQAFDPAITVDNVEDLRPAWVAPDQSINPPGPVVTDVQTAFIDTSGLLHAFDATGRLNCSTSTPRECQPLWIGLTGTQTSAVSPAATIGREFVYLISGLTGDLNQRLLAFDKRGSVRCSGTAPKECQPVWQADLPVYRSGSATVEGDKVFVPTLDGVRVFDAAGLQSCTAGTPRVCAPLWRASGRTVTELAAPAVASGRLYVGTSDGIDVFDASGVTGCTGTPVVCAPLFNLSRDGAPGQFGTVAVLGGRAFSVNESGNGAIHAWDATGATNCAGAASIECTPIWTSSVAISGVPAVAAGVVYGVGQGSTPSLYAFDADGGTACPGTPAVCEPLWSGLVSLVSSVGGGPSIANGVVYVTTQAGTLYAYDAAGSINCTGSSPTVCTPLATFATAGGVDAPASIATGIVYTVTASGAVQAWRRP